MSPGDDVYANEMYDSMARWAENEAKTSMAEQLSAALEDNARLKAALAAQQDGVREAVMAALFEPDEADAIDNLEGALIDIRRFSEQGKPTDAVCIRTLGRIQQQLLKAHQALSGDEQGPPK